ncbi:hypothetical protein [Modestobacter sp. KNN46-3]|uniref:hypothetical protein n=1 Tax=Modestobacter sp. KNN46-3 TaxID=2711218 RepID=UPI0013DF85C1|nr:hypothetical protein [Modestobacter sp. KNN46-3]
MGLRRDISPHEALTEAIQRTAGDVQYLGDVVATMREKDALLHPVVLLYRDAVKDLAAVSRGALSAGVEERRQQLDEAMATVLVTVVREALTRAQFTAEQKAVFGRELGGVLIDHGLALPRGEGA